LAFDFLWSLIIFSILMTPHYTANQKYQFFEILKGNQKELECFPTFLIWTKILIYTLFSLAMGIVKQNTHQYVNV